MRVSSEVFMKVGLDGARNVGSASLQSFVMRGIAREIVVIDRTHEVAKVGVTDQDGAALFSAVHLCVGDCGDLQGAQVVVCPLESGPP